MKYNLQQTEIRNQKIQKWLFIVLFLVMSYVAMGFGLSLQEEIFENTRLQKENKNLKKELIIAKHEQLELLKGHNDISSMYIKEIDEQVDRLESTSELLSTIQADLENKNIFIYAVEGKK